MKEGRASSSIKFQCELFGGFGFVVQFMLALLSFFSLVGKYLIHLVKRQFEIPKRSIRIWFLVICNIKQGYFKTGYSYDVSAFS